ncbi:MAG: ABC transporter permease subunit [Methylobacter sp.]|uniref:ABC transporter permease subunit n=1 Tax=Candidatus Methylobacter titanis TaxID=3053457 RepID=A0AA43Q7H3_9GAMM|nr:ABC transporter permease subunit [Candidatus Methylobacter titanis]
MVITIYPKLQFTYTRFFSGQPCYKTSLNMEAKTMQPGFFNHLLLISLFELKRAFATRKGILSLVTFAVVWYFILLYPLRFAAELLVQEKSLKQDFGFLDFIGFGSIQHWSIPEFGVFWHFALIIFPMLSITLAADQTSSDRERGTLRFIVMRSSRDRIFFGRFAGVMVIQALLIGATAFSTFAMALYRDATLLSSALPNVLVLIVNLILVVLPFTAMMAALSAQVKSARQATVWAILIWTFMTGIISGFAYYLPVLAFLKFLIPGYQLSDLTQLSGWQTLQLAYIPVLQGLILLAFGRWIMARQAL